MKKLYALLLLPLLLSGCSIFDEPSGNKNNQEDEDNYRYELTILNNVDDDYYRAFVVYKDDDYYQIEYKVEKIKYIMVQQSETTWIGQDVETSDVTNEMKDEIKWNVSNANIISVNKEGQVAALNAGYASIYISYKYYISNSISFRSIVPSTKDVEIEQDNIELTLDETYELKYTITPSNATFSIDRNAYNVFNLEDNIITPKEIGKGKITISYVMKNDTEDAENKYIWKSKDINVRVTGETRSPYFTFNGEKATTGSIKFAKNKFKNLDLVEQGISAYSYDGTDITSDITISGEYDLTSSGTYNLTLSVTAPNGYQASFKLKLTIYNFDVEKYTHSFTVDDAFTYEMKVTTDKEDGKTTFTKINYQVTFTKKDFDFLKGDLYIYITAKADRTKQYNGGTLTERIEKNETYHSIFNDIGRETQALARTSFTISGSFYMDEDHNTCKYNSLTWTYRVNLTGEAYNAIYY